MAGLVGFGLREVDEAVGAGCCGALPGCEVLADGRGACG